MNNVTEYFNTVYEATYRELMRRNEKTRVELPIGETVWKSVRTSRYESSRPI